MSKINLDLKKFKHLKSDDKCTTLEHADGHTLTIAHGKLSKDLQAQLNALKDATKSSAEEPKQDTKMFAQGGKVEDNDVSEALKFDALNPNVPALPPPTDTFESKVAEYAKTFPNQPREVLERSAIRDMRESNQALEAGAQSRQVAAADAQYDKEYEQEIKAEEIAATNKNRASAGLPPVEMPQAGQPVTATPTSGISQQATLAPQTAPAVPTAPNEQGLMQSGYQTEMAGIQQEAKAKADLATAQEKLYNDQIVAQQEIKADYDTRFNALETERKAFMDDIKNGQIDPEAYWKNHSKVMAGIGMILAGFTPSQAPNAAAEFIEKQMELNIKAQQQNLESKHNLLAANMKQFGNLREAMDMTRIMQADMVNSQLLSAAAKAANPMAKAAALKAAGELQMKYAPLVQKVAANQTLAKITESANKDPKKMSAMIAAVRQLDPERAKDLEARMVPEIGFASSTEGAKGLREMGTTVKTVNDSVNRLKQIAQSTGKSLSPSAISEADTIRNMLIGQLRVPITGPGAMSEGERTILEKSIPDVTSILSLDSSNMKRLNTLQERVNNQYRNQLQMNGLDASKVPGLQSEQDKIKRLQELRQKAGK